MPPIHVEVRLRNASTEEYVSRVEIEDEVYTYLKNSHRDPVNNGQSIELIDFKHAAHVDSVHVTGVDIMSKNMNNHFMLSDVQLKVHAYEPWGQQQNASSTLAFQSSSSAQAKILNLPHETLLGVWESLEFDESQNIDPEQILNSVVRTVTLLCQANGLPGLLDINRLILFHGPPGCGKSTLCRALSHKLTIRLSRTFRNGKLFEINTQDLLSKYYSESGKLVSEMFNKILNMAQDEKQLICVLIDEIESIASSREHSTQNGECSDTLRATNQLLTALDRVRRKPNIIVFCTSNLLQSIDTAFLDRIFKAVAVPPPCASAVYTILSSTLNSLIDTGAITYDPWPLEDEDVDIGELTDYRARLPGYGQLLTWEAKYPASPGPRLKHIAKKCTGLSGRRLRKLPILAITMYAWEDEVSVHDAIVALGDAVTEKLAC